MAALAASDLTVNLKNAESYTWFAIASYLELKDWSRTLSGTHVAVSNNRRSNVTSAGPQHRDADDVFKRLGPHLRRQNSTSGIQ